MAQIPLVSATPRRGESDPPITGGGLEALGSSLGRLGEALHTIDQKLTLAEAENHTLDLELAIDEQFTQYTDRIQSSPEYTLYPKMIDEAAKQVTTYTKEQMRKLPPQHQLRIRRHLATRSAAFAVKLGVLQHKKRDEALKGGFNTHAKTWLEGIAKDPKLESVVVSRKAFTEHLDRLTSLGVYDIDKAEKLRVEFELDSLEAYGRGLIDRDPGHFYEAVARDEFDELVASGRLFRLEGVANQRKARIDKEVATRIADQKRVKVQRYTHWALRGKLDESMVEEMKLDVDARVLDVGDLQRIQNLNKSMLQAKPGGAMVYHDFEARMWAGLASGEQPAAVLDATVQLIMHEITVNKNMGYNADRTSSEALSLLRRINSLKQREVAQLLQTFLQQSIIDIGSLSKLDAVLRNNPAFYDAAQRGDTARMIELLRQAQELSGSSRTQKPETKPKAGGTGLATPGEIQNRKR